MPLPMMALPRLKTDMPKEALPWCCEEENIKGIRQNDQHAGQELQCWRRADLHIQSHISSCPGCVQGGSFDSLLQCQCIDFKEDNEEGNNSEKKKHFQDVKISFCLAFFLLRHI